jgi:O-antigen ligase
MNTATPEPVRLLEHLDRVMLVSLLLTPLLLMHTRALAEVTIALIGLGFLGRCAVTRDWTWLRTGWVPFALAWWVWQVICSTPIPALHLGEGGMASLTQALLTIRFIVLIAAMEHCVLNDPGARRWLYGVMAASAAYIAFQCLFQSVFGRNTYGWPRYPDGELTGPFGRPRAGPPLARLLMPTILPPVAALLARPGVMGTLAGIGLLIGGMLVIVLIGQRMPLLVALGSLLVAGLLMRRLRVPVLVAGVMTALLVAASPVVAPAAHYRLVVKFGEQLAHFPTSHYGQLYTRAWSVGMNNKLTGMGHDGFGTGCPRPENFRPSLDGAQPDGGGAAICWVHPHNLYLQALADGGLVGLALFCGMMAAWLLALWRGVWARPDPLRVGLFASLAVQIWPIQAANGFTSIPMGGWFFVILGWGLAEARAAARA